MAIELTGKQFKQIVRRATECADETLRHVFVRHSSGNLEFITVDDDAVLVQQFSAIGKGAAVLDIDDFQGTIEGMHDKATVKVDLHDQTLQLRTEYGNGVINDTLEHVNSFEYLGLKSRFAENSESAEITLTADALQQLAAITRGSQKVEITYGSPAARFHSEDGGFHGLIRSDCNNTPPTPPSSRA